MHDRPEISPWRRLVVTGLAAVTLVGGVAACGDDDKETTAGDRSTSASTEAEASSTSTEASTEAATAAFCEPALAVYEIPVPMEESGEPVKEYATKVAAAYEEIIPSLPEDAKADAESARDQFTEVAETGDPGDLQPGLDGATVAAVIESCGVESYDVTMADYAFEGIPDTIPAGPVAFDFENTGKEQHELILLRKNDGVTESVEELLALPEEEAMTKVTFVNAGFAPAGGDGALIAKLEPGGYVYACFIPVGTVGEAEGDGPPHFTEGMAGEFTVE
jgi:hypothetical protein